MSIFSGIEIAASGLTAERARMDVIAENLANANTTRGADGQPYRRKTVVLAEQPFQLALASAVDAQPTKGGVKVAAVVADDAPGRRVHDPEHPDADAEGFVTLPNVNPVTEMVDLITASRAYEANASALTTARTLFQRTFDILR